MQVLWSRDDINYAVSLSSNYQQCYWMYVCVLWARFKIAFKEVIYVTSNQS